MYAPTVVRQVGHRGLPIKCSSAIHGYAVPLCIHMGLHQGCVP
jgi:hypothetical protein